MPPSQIPADMTLKLNDLLCFAVYSASHAFNRVYKPILERLGLTYPQYLVLILLWEEDGRTVGSLGRQLHLESNTLTPLLKRMEALELVVRNRDPKDERQVRIRLTAKGDSLRTAAADVPHCVLDATGMSVEKVLSLKAEIDALRASLEAATGQSGTGS